MSGTDQAPGPKPGEEGFGAPYRSSDHQSILNDGTPAIREHVIPGAQLEAVTFDPASGWSDYRNHGPEYGRDFAVANPETKADAKTHSDGSVPSDNHRTADIKQMQQDAWNGTGDGAQVNRDLLQPSIEHAIETGMNPNDAAKGAVEQIGNLFSLQRLEDSGAAAAYTDHELRSQGSEPASSQNEFSRSPIEGPSPLGFLDATGLGRQFAEVIEGGLGLNLEARNKYFGLTLDQWKQLQHEQELKAVDAAIADEAAKHGMSPDEYREAARENFRDHPPSGQQELWDPDERARMLEEQDCDADALENVEPEDPFAIDTDGDGEPDATWKTNANSEPDEQQAPADQTYETGPETDPSGNPAVYDPSELTIRDDLANYATGDHSGIIEYDPSRSSSQGDDDDDSPESTTSTDQDAIDSGGDGTADRGLSDSLCRQGLT